MVTITELFNRAHKAGYSVRRSEIVRAIKSGKLKAVKVRNRYQVNETDAKNYLNFLRKQKRNFNLVAGAAFSFLKMFILPAAEKYLEMKRDDLILDAEILERKEI